MTNRKETKSKQKKGTHLQHSQPLGHAVRLIYLLVVLDPFSLLGGEGSHHANGGKPLCGYLSRRRQCIKKDLCFRKSIARRRRWGGVAWILVQRRGVWGGGYVETQHTDTRTLNSWEATIQEGNPAYLSQQRRLGVHSSSSLRRPLYLVNSGVLNTFQKARKCVCLESKRA